MKMTENTLHERWADPKKPQKRIIQEVMHDYAPDYELNESDDELNDVIKSQKPL